ncbi:MAG: PAS domain-containing protein [Myxococcales bacterium]|nr:PAS domain-containing protein [Myxococcales bacterium]
MSNTSGDSNDALLQRTLDAMADPVFVKDRAHRWVAMNAAFCDLLGHPREELLNKSDPDIFPPMQVQEFWAMDDALFASGEPSENEEYLTDEQGLVHTIWTRKYPLRDDAGEIIGLVGVISDITTMRARLDAADALEQTAERQRARLAAQQDLMDTMAVPVISVWDGILLMPLVGEISERRAELAQRRLLEAISRESARVVFLDVSGVPSLDGASASTLLRTIAAARLLGARAEIVGVSARVAQLLVELDIALTGVISRASLQAGLRAALLEAGALLR